MLMTVQDLLKDALAVIGVAEIDETPTSSDLNTALRTANSMIDQWSARRLMLRSFTPIVFPTVQGKSTYTFGLTGADVATVKPIQIRYIKLTDNGLDYIVQLIEKQLFDSFSDKTYGSSRPEYAYWDPGQSQQNNQIGTLGFYYTPDKVYTITVEADMYLNEFVNFTDKISFEPAYYEALIYNLGIRLFRKYHDVKTQIPPDIVILANSTMKTIETMNYIQYISGLDMPMKSSKYNIYTDSSA
jgi:hypothetical protein